MIVTLVVTARCAAKTQENEVSTICVSLEI